MGARSQTLFLRISHAPKTAQGTAPVMKDPAIVIIAGRVWTVLSKSCAATTAQDMGLATMGHACVILAGMEWTAAV